MRREGTKEGKKEGTKEREGRMGGEKEVWQRENRRHRRRR